MAHGNRVCGAASFTYNYDLHRRDTYGSDTGIYNDGSVEI